MRIALLAVTMVGAVALAGCAQMRVTERHFIRPDPAGTVIEKRFAGKSVT